MKKRIKIDTSILSFVIVMTGILFLFTDLYPRSRLLDNTFDFFGFMLVLKGTLLRMCARGHKKKHSQKSKSLVTTGPYAYVRNPMYLGSFLMGAGFVLIVWPFWSLPIFAILFYMRFRIQVVKEEVFLAELFGTQYETYCRKVPRAFPSISQMFQANIKEVWNLEEAFMTKEKRGLYTWPPLAVGLELFQELIVFKDISVISTVLIFLSSAAFFTIIFGLSHKISSYA